MGVRNVFWLVLILGAMPAMKAFGFGFIAKDDSVSPCPYGHEMGRLLRESSP